MLERLKELFGKVQAFLWAIGATIGLFFLRVARGVTRWRTIGLALAALIVMYEFVPEAIGAWFLVAIAVLSAISQAYGKWELFHAFASAVYEVVLAMRQGSIPQELLDKLAALFREIWKL